MHESAGTFAVIKVTQDPGVTFSFRTSGIYNALQDVLWRFPEWIHSYITFGMVPKILIDGKYAANRFGLPLVTVTEPCHEGHVKLFAMGFLRTEESSVSWFLQKVHFHRTSDAYSVRN